ncbi:MAG: M23 family metallopeptidase, partial [Chryseobacterium sp.]|nr:M23 family metallopeptidase [Chryseobacterium sp.]
MSSTLEDKSVKVIPPKTKRVVITELKSIDPKKGTHFEDNVYYVLGDVNIVSSNKNFIYDLPFAKNKTYEIYQGYNGFFSHQSAYSLDFSLKNSDQVFASRAGKVVQIVTKNNQNCPRKECAKFNNEIILMQSDGTLAEYVHLKQNGSVVKLGDDVLQGQLIGYSGSTGWTNGPHLHFSVFVNKIDGQRSYIKTKFRTSKSSAEYLLEKKSYLKNY